jgi:hypothetical protein
VGAGSVQRSEARLSSSIKLTFRPPIHLQPPDRSSPVHVSDALVLFGSSFSQPNTAKTCTPFFITLDVCHSLTPRTFLLNPTLRLPHGHYPFSTYTFFVHSTF